MAYQKCPVCCGTGITANPYLPLSEGTCTVCQGAKIIDEYTGLPPEGQIPKVITTTGDLGFLLFEEKK